MAVAKLEKDAVEQKATMDETKVPAHPTAAALALPLHAISAAHRLK